MSTHIPAHAGALMEFAKLNNPYVTPSASLAPDTQNSYMPVSARKLTIMVLGTSCLYAIYWFYRQWLAYAQRTGGSQWAWARGFFWWLFAYNLFGKLDKELVEQGESINWSHRMRGLVLVGAGVASVLISLIGTLYSVLPSIIVVLIAAFMLRGAVPAINRLANDPEGDSNARLTWANWIWLVLGGFMWVVNISAVLLILVFPETFTP